MLALLKHISALKTPTTSVKLQAIVAIASGKPPHSSAIDLADSLVKLQTILLFGLQGL